jgi:hypothetical protein
MNRKHSQPFLFEEMSPLAKPEKPAEEIPESIEVLRSSLNSVSLSFHNFGHCEISFALRRNPQTGKKEVIQTASSLRGIPKERFQSLISDAWETARILLLRKE